MEQIIEYFHYNSYVTLTFFFSSLAVLILNTITFGAANKYIFSTEKKSLLNPLTYVRLFTHILGHSDWNHFSGNFLKILLLGPLIEEKYGSIEFLIMILITALVTGIVNYIKGDTRLCGASGVAFMLIVLSACVNIVDDKIPLTLVLIILFYIIDEVKDLRKKDNIAHYGHIAGALCGGLFGFLCVNQAFMESFRNIINNIIG